MPDPAPVAPQPAEPILRWHGRHKRKFYDPPAENPPRLFANASFDTNHVGRGVVAFSTEARGTYMPVGLTYFLDAGGVTLNTDCWKRGKKLIVGTADEPYYSLATLTNCPTCREAFRARTGHDFVFDPADVEGYLATVAYREAGVARRVFTDNPLVEAALLENGKKIPLMQRLVNRPSRHRLLSNGDSNRKFKIDLPMVFRFFKIDLPMVFRFSRTSRSSASLKIGWGDFLVLE